MTRGEARMTLTRAVTDYFTLWDRCGGSEAIAADLFAEARQNMRDALAAQAGQPGEQPQSPPDSYRWRQPGNKHWIYDPTPEWIEDHKHEIELEALFASPVSRPDRDSQ